MSPARPRPEWEVMAVTLLVGIAAICLAWPQIFPAPDQSRAMTLPNLSERASQLKPITNQIQRDSLCIPLAAYGRSLDRALAPEARIFLSGMLGKANAPRLGYYFFLRNYLFPRDVDISLGQRAIFYEGWFDGTPCDSPAVLQTNGYDLFLLMPTNSDNIQIIPLTQKGVPRQ